MLWLLLLPAQGLFGFSIGYKFLKGVLSDLEILAVSIPFGFLVSSLFYFVLSSYLGINMLHSFLHTVALFVSSFYILKEQLLHSTFKQFRLTHVSYMVVSFVIASFLVMSSYSVSKYRSMPIIGDIFYEDLSLVRTFTVGVNSQYPDSFHIHHPICVKCFIYSRWLVSFHTAILEKAKCPMSIAFKFPHIVYIASAFFLTRSLLSSFTGTLMFFFLGGFGFTTVSVNRNNRSVDYVHSLGSKGLTSWGHPFYHYLLSRSSSATLALSACAILILTKKASKHSHMMVGMLIGLVSALQHETFYAFLVFFAFYYTVTFYNGSDKQYLWSFLCGLAITCLIPVANYYPRNANRPLLKFQKIWSSINFGKHPFPVLAFWYRCLGIFPVVSIFVGLNFSSKSFYPVMVSALVSFMAANFMKMGQTQLQTMHAFYPVSILIFSSAMSRAFKKNKTNTCLLWICFVALHVTSSILGMYNIGFRKVTEISDRDKVIGNWIMANTSTKAVFIGNDRPHHPVQVITGRRTVTSNSFYLKSRHFEDTGYQYEHTRLLKDPGSDIMPLIQYVYDDPGIFEDQRMKGPDVEKYWTTAFEYESARVLKRRLPRWPC